MIVNGWLKFDSFRLLLLYMDNFIARLVSMVVKVGKMQLD